MEPRFTHHLLRVIAKMVAGTNVLEMSYLNEGFDCAVVLHQYGILMQASLYLISPTYVILICFNLSQKT